MKKFGILGGSGAFGSCHLLQQILSIAKQYATNDSDFPYIVFYNSPLDGLNAKGEFSDNTFPTLLKHIQEMESVGCSHIVLACNTAHYFFQDLKAHLKDSTILINMLTLLSEELQRKEITQPLVILCSQRSRGLHQEYLTNITYPEQSTQDTINKLISKVISGQQSAADYSLFNRIVTQLSHANHVVIACTELSVLNQSGSYIDTCTILARYINTLHNSVNNKDSDAYL